MKCHWDALLSILPGSIRSSVDKFKCKSIQEIRLRIDQSVELTGQTGFYILPHLTTVDDICFCINAASKFSPWAVNTFQHGFITAPGGHRIGLCGTFIKNSSDTATLKDITSICIRVSRDIPGLASGVMGLRGSTLIIGSPGSGKTTLLRDLIRQKSNDGQCVCVVDERQEIFPIWQGSFCYDVGKRTDVIGNCSKRTGIEMLLRAMGPEIIAVDEITGEADARTLLKAGWCGVSVIATAHAYDRAELYTRPVYKTIVDAALFDNLIIMRQDKSWSLERMKL